MSQALRILVVDDDPVMREVLEALLEMSGHQVTLVDSGEAALAALRQASEHPDLLLTDLRLPGLEGEALAARLIEERRAGTLVIGMSGGVATEAEMRLLDGFLQKPFTPEQVQAAVAQARAGHAARPADAPREEAAGDSGAPPVLNEEIFTRLAATLPAAQVREIYDMTLDDVRARVERMQACLAAGDLAAVRREAHAAKGSCGMMGAAELAHIAATTEGGTSEGSVHLADFAPACERLERMLDARLAPRS